MDRLLSYVKCLLYLYFMLSCSALPVRKFGIPFGSEIAPPNLFSKKLREGLPPREPSCEELRAMWRQSKRHMRVPEITNEIPTYRDPFAYNVWEPLARSRNIGGAVLRGFKPKFQDQVYGRVVHDSMRPRMREMSPERQKIFKEITDFYAGSLTPVQASRRPEYFRISGGGAPFTSTQNSGGSFQKLKEMIREERARELQQQRMIEEAAARASSFKGKHNTHTYYGHVISSPQQSQQLDEENDDKSSEEMVKPGILTFPDPLAPAATDLGSVNKYHHSSTRGDKRGVYKDWLIDFADEDGYPLLR